MSLVANRIGALLAGVVLGLVVVLCLPVVARADVPPHVTDGEQDTDICAMCHRTHTAAGSVEWRSPSDPAIKGSALIASPTGDKGDAAFCYTCHGTEAIGADSNVQSSFEATSHHSLEPSASPYGPSPKQCSDCHDSHGTARTAAGSPYPALLRSYNTTGAVYTGEQYCANCHKPRAGSTFDGLDVFKQTAHYSEIPTPTSGTGIRCDICHQPHGSSVAPLLASKITSPAIPGTVTVSANDRTFCFACHSAASVTYPGTIAYQASAHAQSTATVGVAGEWASTDATRVVGECQNCHDPMGRSDGKGGVIPKLAQKAGTALCLTCHTVKGPASTDFVADTYPTTATPTELVAGWSPATSTVAYSRLALYSQDPTSTQPHALVGPREYRVPGHGTGRIAVGDVDGDGASEILATEPGQTQLALFDRDPLRGVRLVSGALPIDFAADFLAVGDFLGSASNQIAVISATGRLRLYTYDGATLVPAAAETTLDPGITSVATGDVTGTASPDLVLSAGDSDLLDVVTSSGAGMAKTGAFPVGPYPTGVSVGDIWPEGGKSEICVLSGSGPGKLSVFDGDGNDKADYALSGAADASPTASAIGDVFPSAARPGKEVVVAIADASGDSTIAVFPRLDAGGLAAPSLYAASPRANTGSLAVGDVDGDAHDELIVGNAGRWAADQFQVPSIEVFHATAGGDALDASAQTFVGGGVELSGAAPSLAVADVGAGPSRHPWGVLPGAHVSTETVGFGRHVECVDCHEVHESTSTAGTAPDAYGAIKGATGVSVKEMPDGSVDLVYAPSVRYEYELCFKCHSGWPGSLDGRGDLPVQFDTRNASVHAVEASANTSIDASTFVGSWGNDSVMYCKDCHTDADPTRPSGPHASSDAPILGKPYLGISAADGNGLCYKCHRSEVYRDGAAGSGFKDVSGSTTQLHSLHTSGRGIGCEACHVTHGSNLPHLLNADVKYGDGGSATSCKGGCHPGGVTYTP